MSGPDLILASASRVRRDLLRAAGVGFEVIPADIDEAALKADHTGDDAGDIAVVLAAAKAIHVSRRRSQGHPGALVIGADQVLELDGRLYDKPPNIAAAADHLRDFRGKTHRLHAALALAVDDRVVWRHVESASLTMRSFSDEFLARYLACEGDAALASVGAYRLEGMGVQLFERIDGSYFTILGLPLLALLEELRIRGMLDI